MRLNNFKILLVILFIFNLSNYAYAAKNNVISELYVFSKDKKTFKEKIKKTTKTQSKIPRPKTYRSVTVYKFNEDFINKYIKPNSLMQLDEMQFGEIETLDLNENGIADTIIYFNNPITAYLDLNENNIDEIEYVFNGSERYIYYDENEDKIIDYVFIDYNGDGIDEEIIKIEN